MSDSCGWVEDTLYGTWLTECKESFCFEDGGPLENSMRYCPYCGKPLVVEEPEPEEGDYD